MQDRIARYLLVAAVTLVLGLPFAAQASVVVETVLIGNVGNPGDTRYPGGGVSSFGVVVYAYAMGKYEVTVDQYTAFSPDEARQLIEKIEVVHTLKHGSWLNMAECELSVLEKQALGERVGDETALRKQIAVWESDRNHRFKGIHWQFRTADARIKFHRLYQKIQLC